MPPYANSSNKVFYPNPHYLIGLPNLSPVLSEWASVIPLVCHLATYKHDWELVGRISLNGRLSTSIFPKLGVLAGLSRLLERGPDFIDQTSSKGRPGWRVWDVRWGGSFPCANGGASAMIMDYALKKEKGKVMDMPDKIPPQEQPPTSGSKLSLSTLPTQRTIVETLPHPIITAKSSGSSQSPPRNKSRTQSSQSPRGFSTASPSKGSSIPEAGDSPRKPTAVAVSKGHRRYQTLHLLQFRRRKTRRSWLLRLDLLLTSATWESFKLVGRIAVVSVLCLLGLFGTSTILMCGAVSQIGCRMVKVDRPPGYLESNEQEQESSMLVALHENSCTWYLFHGERAVIDSLLNKTMISIPKSSKRTALSWILRTTHIMQLLAMTFVAGQKGWDGVGLVILMIFDHMLAWKSSDGNAARRWMESEGVDVCVNSFNFTGRTMLIGAVHSLSGSESPSWMDNILAPFPRRDAWLKRLGGLQTKSTCEEIMSNISGRWSEHDWKSIVISSELAHRSAEVLRAAKSKTVSA